MPYDFSCASSTHQPHVHPSPLTATCPPLPSPSSLGLEWEAPPPPRARLLAHRPRSRETSQTYLFTLFDVIVPPGIGASNEHDFELLLVPAMRAK